jgi:hypothetical protein
LIAHAFGSVLCIVLGELWMRTKFVTRELAGLGALGLTGFVLLQPQLRAADPPYRAIAQLLAPHVSAATPGYPSFVARDHQLLQGYLDRAGMSWQEYAASGKLGASQAAAPPSAFVVGPRDLNEPSAREALVWLEDHTRELTSELSAQTGAPGQFRVFVRP